MDRIASLHTSNLLNFNTEHCEEQNVGISYEHGV